jgi:hypothetical protein
MIVVETVLKTIKNLKLPTKNIGIKFKKVLNFF